MYQAGTGDMLIKQATVEKNFAAAHSPRYLVEFKDAGHFSFTELSMEYQQAIADYAIAFFDRELMHRPAPLLDRKASGQVADYRHD